MTNNEKWNVKFICFLIVVLFGVLACAIVDSSSQYQVEKRALHAEAMKQACLPPSAIVEEKQGDLVENSTQWQKIPLWIFL